MIICFRARRREDGAIDTGETASIRAVRESDVSEIIRENGGKVLVRIDGEPAEYWDGVVIENGESIVSDEMKAVMDALDEEDSQDQEPPKRRRGRPRKNA